MDIHSALNKFILSLLFPIRLNPFYNELPPSFHSLIMCIIIKHLRIFFLLRFSVLYVLTCGGGALRILALLASAMKAKKLSCELQQSLYTLKYFIEH